MYEQIPESVLDSKKDLAVVLRDLDTRVEYWHTHETGASLREYLGMEPDEYELWLKDGDGAVGELIRRRTKTVRRTVWMICPYCGMRIQGTAGQKMICRHCHREMRMEAGFRM